ncbi:MAG: STAS domain-containing protein [Planctomycetota bacterium]|jgi:anti-anti-sigma factor
MTDFNLEEKEVARRRWRNMLISAMSAGEFTQDQRIHLEKMRREFGISMSEASAMGAELRKSGGSITLFGSRKQKLSIFRDILTMIYVDEEINEKEKKLIISLANKLDIAEEELDKHITECREALSSADEEKKSSISARIFRKVISSVDESSESDRFIKTYEEADNEVEKKDLQVFVLQRLTEISKKSTADSSDLREHVVKEDKECSKRLIASGAVTEPQLVPFLEEQEALYNERGRVVSLLTLMVKKKVLEQSQVDHARAMFREENPIDGGVIKSITSEDDTLTVSYYKDTVDHTFYMTVIRPSGQIDHHTIPLLHKVFDEVCNGMESENRLIIMDFSEIEYIGSAAIGAIFENRVKIMESWGDLRFCAVKDEVKDVMNLIGVDTFIEICDDLNAAKWSFTDLRFTKEAEDK